MEKKRLLPSFGTKFVFPVFVIAILFCVISCNLFNPTNDSDIDADDADALVYEGQLLFRNAEYSKAARYFAKAIKADSTKSQAWFGLSKAQMYASSVSPFDMITYIHVDEGSIPFMGISKYDIERFHDGAGLAIEPLRELVRRDTLTELYNACMSQKDNVSQNERLQKFKETYGPDYKGFPLSDRKVIFANFSVSYEFLEFADMLLDFQYSNRDFLLDISINSETDQLEINLDSLYNAALNNSGTVDILNSSIDSLKNNINNIVDVVIPTVTVLLNGTSILDSLTGDTSGVDGLVDDIVTEKVNTVGQTITFYKIGDSIDNDGDGCVDEEVMDGKDNDGDGFVDEDLRLVLLSRENSIYGEEGYNEITIIHDTGATSDSLDHDGDGIIENIEERTFIYENTEERKAANDYRLVFASTFNSNVAADSTKTHWRVVVMADIDSTNVTYSLNDRQTNIGGCWVNYDENRFRTWFRNR
jgi:hypothetical protein